MKKKSVLVAITFFFVHFLYGQMVLQYNITTPYTQINLPLNGNVHVSVDWGDGSTETFTTAVTQMHFYSTTGIKTVTITGYLTRFGIYGGQPLGPLVSVQGWDNLGLTSLSWAFYSAASLTSVPTTLPSTVTDLSYMFSNFAPVYPTTFNQPIDTWNTDAVTNMEGMFYYNTSFNQSLDAWNTASVINMSRMFLGASAFNQPVGSWNTAAVTDMSLMFSGASAFNQPIGAWNTSAVTNMELMFSEAYTFNYPVGDWNTAAVTNMEHMFENAGSFNQPIANWNTAAVTNMDNMFEDATSFNQSIGNWNTARVTGMNNMFEGAVLFNQPIDSWDTHVVTGMGGMFAGAKSFNQPIGSWNTVAVIYMGSMFQNAVIFNQPIGAWNTSSAITMDLMFYGASSFNQPIGSWNTSSVTSMDRIFLGATSFDQPIGSWDIRNVTSMANMFGGDMNDPSNPGYYIFVQDTLCTVNYDNLLNGWSSQTVTANLDFTAGASQYSTASTTARINLMNQHGWTISDGGLNLDDTKCYSAITTGLQSNTVSKLIGIYPNPSTGQITISGNEALGNILICNSLGVVVYKTETNALQQHIDISNNEPGFYLIKVGNQTSKLIKE